MIKIRYFDIAWLSKVDGPGKRVVLFLQGCHLKCPWCHSPHSWEFQSPILFNETRCISCYKCVEICDNNAHIIADGVHKIQRSNCIKCGKCIEACPASRIGLNSGALSLPTQDEDASTVFKLLLPQLEVVKDCGGITLSGGEALLQKEEVLKILRDCKSHGIHTAIESSLTLPTEVYSYVSNFVDCWLIGIRDISFQDSDKNTDELMLKNIKYISSLDKEVIVRFPVIKGSTESKNQLERLVSFMNIGKFKKIEILPCNQDMEHYYKLCGIEPLLQVEQITPSNTEIKSIADFFRMNGFNVKVIN